MTSYRIQGTCGSPGIATGEALVLSTSDSLPKERRIPVEQIPGEMLRLQDALSATREQIMKIRERVGHEIGEEDAGIFDVHLMLVDDQSLIEKVLAGLHESEKNLEAVLHAVVEDHVAALSRTNDDYLKGRAADLRDVAGRILRNLGGESDTDLSTLEKGVIVVTRDLSPSETATMDPSKVLGFATDIGSPTSHTAIMARSMDVPAIVALHDITRRVTSGDTLILDGASGLVIVNPSPEELSRFGTLDRMRGQIRSRLDPLREQPAQTVEGHRLHLMANIESPDDPVENSGAEGVGLFRTEYLYLTCKEPPSEEEQSDVLKEVARKFAPAPVIIRTMDFGGDKVPAHHQLPTGRNPFMGCRGIRYCLATQPELFRAQLRAILRASNSGNVAILYPMISVKRELTVANEMLARAKEELRAEGVAFDENIETGAMIEVPASALALDLLTSEISFVSIGTNDLVQYVFAADRTNERTAHLHQPAHPAFLRLLRGVVEQAHSKGIRVGVCGEMAANPLLSVLLVGLEIDDLSMTPQAIPIVKSAIRNVRFDDAQGLSKQALKSASAGQVLDLCSELIRRSNPEILDLVDVSRTNSLE